MALNRADTCRHFMDGAAFVQCLCYYNGTHASKSGSWEIVVRPTDMPAGQETNPTDAQVMAVADAKAVVLYNAWKAAIDANTVVEASHAGQSGVVVA